MVFAVDAVTLAFASGIIALVYAVWLAFVVLRAPRGNEKMQEISRAVQEGAGAYLARQYKTLTPFVVLLLLAIGFFIDWRTASAFLAGVVASALAGYVGMMVSVRGNTRVAEAARKGLKPALSLAFKGGAVTGMALAGLALVGVSLVYSLFGELAPLVGFGFGASLISLFARVGGGIYTKAADVGADLVGKVEKGIPEDDSRNPAVIADNVGDNVGDCAGMAADVFESFVVTIIAGMLLGAAPNFGGNFVTLPLAFAAVGVLASVIGSFFVRLGGGKAKIMNAFYKGIAATAVFSLIGFLYFAFSPELFYVGVVGLAVTAAVFLITDYYTAKEHKPVQDIAVAAKTGAGTNLIQGLAVGMQSTALPAIIVVIAIALSYAFAGLYGIALAAVAMLSLSGIVIAVDAYGPITDNAGGIAEMSKMPESVRRVTDPLDAVGNTTKATTKGFAIAGAALGALALFAAFAEATQLASINLLEPAVVIGLFVGALLPFLFSSFLMKAVGRAAFDIVEEVRRQFREIKGLMSGKARADYAKCVDISTSAALRELLVPGLLAVLTPLVVGFLFGASALAGLLAGAIATGFLLALMMCTGGAAWDNAKKYVEEGAFGGKGSEAHKAAVVGDTVGDPFKDTAGPSLNALIKVLNTVSLVFAAVIAANALKLV